MVYHLEKFRQVQKLWSCSLEDSVKSSVNSINEEKITFYLL